MQNSDNKRKKNRIQGGWGKSEKNKEKNIQIGPVDDIIIFESDMAPQFDKNIAIDLPKAFKLITIEKDGDYDLNNKSDINGDDIGPARVQFLQTYIPEKRSVYLFKYFLTHLPWEQRENATKSGEVYDEPRETCWYGLPYSYSRVNMPPNSNWDPKLKQLLEQVQEFAEADKPFNSVMCNLYRHAKHSIDWHADDEKSLGDKPFIASISLGSTRVFELCKRTDLYEHYKSQSKSPYRSRDKDEPPFDECSILYEVFLNSGSLLTMSGSVQDHWLHRVPKEYHDHHERINFTFRHII